MNRPHARFNNFHGPKRQLVGHHVQPAWRPNAVVNLAQKQAQQVEASGSKILLSRLPTDVGEKEVEELFRKTVGPVKDCFLIYNDQGKSKGMAVVAFVKPSDAASAKTKYHGKIVDGRKPLSIEIVVDEVPKAAPPSAPPTLLQRLSGPTNGQPKPPPIPAPQRIPPRGPARNLPPIRPPFLPRPAVVAPIVPIRPRQKVKKGPKRLQKRPLTAAELDQEMDDYLKQAPQEVEMDGEIL